MNTIHACPIRRTLNFWMLAVSLLAISGSLSPVAAETDVVNVDVTIGSYLDVEFQSSEIVMNPVLADEFFISNPMQQQVHSGSSLINVRSNVTCSLRTRQNIELNHEDENVSAPALPVTASIVFFGLNQAYSINIGGELFWVLNYTPGLHVGTTSMLVSIQQEWTAANIAGLYTGTVTIELVEGTL